MHDTVLFAYSARMCFSAQFNEIFVLLLFYFLASHGFKICQMNNKIIQLFLCSRYDAGSPFRIQTLSSLPWLPKYPIWACSSFDTSGKAYLLQICYTLFEKCRYTHYEILKKYSHAQCFFIS